MLDQQFSSFRNSWAVARLGPTLVPLQQGSLLDGVSSIARMVCRREYRFVPQRVVINSTFHRPRARVQNLFSRVVLVRILRASPCALMPSVLMRKHQVVQSIQDGLLRQKVNKDLRPLRSREESELSGWTGLLSLSVRIKLPLLEE